MRLSIFAISILAVVASMACSHDDGGKKNNGGNVVVTDVTDKTQCGVGAATSIEGTWANTRVFKASNGSGTLVTLWTITGTNVKVTGLCTVGNQSAQDSVNESSSYTATQLSVYGSDSKTSTCPVSIQAGTYNYQFNGSCLQVSRDGETETFVPSSGGNQVSQTQNQSGFRSIDRSQVPTDPNLKMPEMPKMPKMPTMPQFPTEDPNLDN